jgi:chemotaxis methyl-accepting protein methylase
MTNDLERLAALIERDSGIHLDHGRHRMLAAAAARVAPTLSTVALLDALTQGLGGRPLLRALIDEVAVNETFFFRQADELIALDWGALAASARAAGSSTVRVWVAACSSGEEAFTLAMLAAERAVPVSITATDISGSILAQARQGHYTSRSTRAVPPELLRRHFTPAGPRLSTGPALRRSVCFERNNLVQDPPPAPASFDLITCRNALIYFDADTAARVVQSLTSALAPGGRLILGAADRISVRSETQVRVSMQRREPRAQPPARRARPARERPVTASPRPQVDATGDAIQQAANAGRLQEVIELTDTVLAGNPLDARACFTRGLAELGLGNPQAAVASLRRAIYADPGFGLAAFTLGRALEQCGEPAAAVQAYRQALRALAGAPEPDPLDQLDPLASFAVGDVALACHLRLRTLAQSVVNHKELG